VSEPSLEKALTHRRDPSRLDLTASTRYMGTRRLLKEGILAKAKSGRKLYGFLCSDILVLTDESMKTLYRMVCSWNRDSSLVAKMIIANTPGPRSNHSW
jgi:hypothetical protein